MNYKNPALVEIFAEFYLVKDSLPADKLFELAEKVKGAGFPKVDIGQHGAINIPGQDEVEQPQFTLAPRLRCWSGDKNRLVQISPDLLVMNLVGHYPGWEDYRSFVNKILDATNECLKAAAFRSISLNTTDKFEVPSDGFSVAKYLDVKGPRIPAWYSSAKEACDIDLGWGLLERDGFNRQLHIKVRPAPSKTTLHIQSTFHVTVPEGKGVQEVLEELHAESSASFESMITEVTRKEVMGGVQ